MAWARWWKDKRSFFLDLTEWRTRSRLSKLLFWLTFVPFRLAFFLTIPSTVKGRYDRDLLTATPFFSSFLFVFYTHAWWLEPSRSSHVPVFLLIPFIGLCLSVTRRSRRALIR